MDASLAGMWVAAGLAGFWALVLAGVLALRLLAGGAPAAPRRDRRARLAGESRA